MGRKKGSKNKFEEANLTSKEIEIDLEKIKNKRNSLIADLKPKLLTKKQLIEGIGDTPIRHQAESAYQPVVDEINELGEELDLSKVTLGSLRG